MLTVLGLLVLIAFILVIVSAIGKCPLWIPLLLVTIVMLIQYVPGINLR